MKVWQIGAIGGLACILGCGGAGAYVPDENTNTGGNPSQCAALSTIVPADMVVNVGSSSEYTVAAINGQVNALQQTRAPGDAVVTWSITGLPAGTSADFTANPITVGLNDSASSTLTITADNGNQQEAISVVTITATEAGCTPVSHTSNLDVVNQGS